MPDKTPATPRPSRNAESVRKLPVHALGQALVSTGQAFHMEGDKAAKLAEAAKSRRAQRKWQSVNKAARAVGTAAEASLWLVNTVAAGMRDRKVSMPAIEKRMQPVFVEAVLSLDDLAFEARALQAYAPQDGGPKPSSKAPPMKPLRDRNGKRPGPDKATDGPEAV